MPSDALKLDTKISLTKTAVFPGEEVEGSVEITASCAFKVQNIHLKIVGKERVNAMVDQVKQSKTDNLQFGISSQDYVYYREILTLAGDLMTVKRGKSATGTPNTRSVNGDEGSGGAANASFALQDALYMESAVNNDSIASRRDPRRISLANSFASVAAAEAMDYVCFPEGTYVYPFRFLLPDELPPSYETGVRVKDAQFSNSSAHLAYYVKLYTTTASGKTHGEVRADFTVHALRPLFNNRTFLGCRGLRLRPDGQSVACRFALRGGLFGLLHHKNKGEALEARLILDNNFYQIAKDRVTVTVDIPKNNTSKDITGFTVDLIQHLTFKTDTAEVKMTQDVLTHHFDDVVAKDATDQRVTLRTDPVPHDKSVLPTCSTTGLDVSYGIRVTFHTKGALHTSHEFTGVILAAPPLEDGAEGDEPEYDEEGYYRARGPGARASEMSFNALPRGRLTRREAYYMVPNDPCVPAQLPTFPVPSKSRAPSVKFGDD